MATIATLTLWIYLKISPFFFKGFFPIRFPSTLFLEARQQYTFWSRLSDFPLSDLEVSLKELIQVCVISKSLKMYSVSVPPGAGFANTILDWSFSNLSWRPSRTTQRVTKGWKMSGKETYQKCLKIFQVFQRFPKNPGKFPKNLFRSWIIYWADELVQVCLIRKSYENMCCLVAYRNRVWEHCSRSS